MLARSDEGPLGGSRPLAGLMTAEPGDRCQERALLKRAAEGDSQAADLLVRAHLRLVAAMARRFRGRAPEEDLLQAGCLGLVKALSTYDPCYGTRFSTYAVPVVLGELRRAVRDEQPLSTSRAERERGRVVVSTRSTLAQELGREPTVAEVAGRLGWEPDEVVAATEVFKRPLSLDAPSPDGDREGTPGTDRLPSPRGAAEEGVVERVALAELLTRLPAVEREILEERFYGRRTQAEAAAAVGLSQPQVSRLERRALMRLREWLGLLHFWDPVRQY